MSTLGYTIKSIGQVINEFNTSFTGLKSKDIEKLQKRFGQNELSGQQTYWYDILFRQFKSPFLYLLIGASVVSFLLGETLDTLMILLFVFINASLGFFQEHRSEKTIQLLQQYIIAKSRVIRDGKEIMVNSTEIVPGDIINLQPGDIIPADIRFISIQNLAIDESVLTGEAVEISKTSAKLSEEVKNIYQAKNIGFAGTNVKSGKGSGIVVAIGKNTTVGSITSLTTGTKHTSSFEIGISKLSSFILKLVSITLIMVILINIFIKGPSNLPTLLIFAIALAISVIPEALPVVTIFSFARGAIRLAKHKVVVKRLSSIEDLGSIEVLCTDKTGTITENKLTVSNYFPKNSNVLLYGALATALISKDEHLTDSFDLALMDSLENKNVINQYKRLAELPFDPKRKRNSVLIKKNSHYELIVRGAAENVFSICAKIDMETKHAFLNFLENEGRQGKRIIAIAKKAIVSSKDHLPNMKEEEKNHEFVGLISFTDPLKKSAHHAIEKARDLGVQIKILTGDSCEVAGAVAKEIGLIDNENNVMKGDEFDSLDLDKQHKVVEEYNVFARVSPEQKHKINLLLREKYEVGFLGEGINDAPALKAASVAIVVQGASDIGRETADIVLLNKSLDVIIDGIMEGREIFGNTVKYIKTTLASNFGNFYTVAISSLFITFLPLLPLQILLINLLTDFPMIAVAMDNVDKNDLKKPKNYDIKEIALFATVMGGVSSFFDFLFFFSFFKISPQVLQTNWFIGSVITELLFLFSVRTRLSIFKASFPAPILLGLSAVALLTTLILPFTLIGKQVFQFITPSISNLSLILLITLTYFVVSEIVKMMYYSFTSKK